MGWEKGNNTPFLFIFFYCYLCGKEFLEKGEGNNAIFFIIILALYL